MHILCLDWCKVWYNIRALRFKQRLKQWCCVTMDIFIRNFLSLERYCFTLKQTISYCVVLCTSLY